MKKYFLISDIHSFYTPLMTALEKKGFDRCNTEHILVVLGDVFDRGPQTLEIYNFLRSFPDNRLILIRGNHELLYLDLLKKDFPDSYDFSNGTVRTFCAVAGYSEEVLSWRYWFILGEEEPYEKIQQTWKEILKEVENSEITKWLQSEKWINYLETDKYIMVHSFIPLKQITKDYYNIEIVGYREDWRNATQTEWDDAMWGCPWALTKEGYNKTGKTIICGHWHTSDFFNHLTKQRKGKYECPVFKSKRYKLIGLDACTAASGKVNVLVLNEDEL